MSIFVSYSHTDSDFVDKITNRLIEKNIKVWKDKWKTLAGDSFVTKIKDGINGASFFCLVLSKNSMKSEWVSKELKLALAEEAAKKDFKILALLLDDTRVPLTLKDRIYADFRSDFEAGLAQLLAVVASRYNMGEGGRVSAETPYYLDYGFEEKLIDGKFFLQLDVVSFDLEEQFSILSQFIFRGNENATEEYLELGSDTSIRNFVLLACADEFEHNPARVTLKSTETKRARFTIEDGKKLACFGVDVRIKWLGKSSGQTTVFNVGALMGQICADYGLK